MAEIIKPKLHHWGMRVQNFDAMVDWYAKVCGFETVLSSDVPIQSAFVTNDEQHHRGGFFALPMVGPHPEGSLPAAVNHLAYEYETLDDLLASWERLVGEGIEPLITTDHGPTFAFYYKDPDGHTVELLCDAYGDPQRSMEHMLRPDMVQNPMGSPVDPAKLLEARRAGVSQAEIHERAQAGEYAPPADAPPPNPLILA